MSMSVGPVRLERFGPFQMWGLFRSHRYPRDHDIMFQVIAGQWREYLELAGSLGPGSRKHGYGIGLWTPDGATTFDYFCGMPVAHGAGRPRGLVTLEIPALVCGVFRHRERITEFRDTMALALGTALPFAGLAPADERSGSPEFIERYWDSFDPETGCGGLDVLIPLRQ